MGEQALHIPEQQGARENVHQYAPHDHHKVYYRGVTLLLPDHPSVPVRKSGVTRRVLSYKH